MGTIRLRTVTDFIRHGYMVRVECRLCGHSKEIDPRKLWQQAQERGFSLQIGKLERQLRCQACRQLAAAMYPGVSVDYQGDGG